MGGSRLHACRICWTLVWGPHLQMEQLLALVSVQALHQVHLLLQDFGLAVHCADAPGGVGVKQQHLHAWDLLQHFVDVEPHHCGESSITQLIAV